MTKAQADSFAWTGTKPAVGDRVESLDADGPYAGLGTVIHLSTTIGVLLDSGTEAEFGFYSLAPARQGAVSS